MEKNTDKTPKIPIQHEPDPLEADLNLMVAVDYRARKRRIRRLWGRGKKKEALEKAISTMELSFGEVWQDLINE